MKLLIVDDDEDILFAAELLLKKYFDKVTTLSDPDMTLNLLQKERHEVVMLDMNFTKDISSGSEGFFLLNNIIKSFPETKVVMVTAFGNVEKAVKALKMGAIDFVSKPWDNDALVKNMLQIQKMSVDQPKKATGPTNQTHQIIFHSASMTHVMDMIKKVAPSDANILILGENGTGKELIAKEIHHLSLRAEKLFVNVDLGSLNPSVFESELFGHVKGAFTDAKEERVGRFEMASGGTLFLDEIANTTLEQQAKLLSAIQTNTVCKMGGNKPIHVGARFIAATNADIKHGIKEKSFREDLYFRLNTIEIHVPPLRDRKEDILLLSSHFNAIYSEKYNKTTRYISESTSQKMCKYTWPGNIRELMHAIEKAVLLSENDDLEVSIPEEYTQNMLHLDKSATTLHLENMEKNAVIMALKKNEGNISKAANELGLTRASLYRRMEKFNI